MRFKDASKIHDAVESMRLANYPVALNRAKVNDLFNGNPPWSESERGQNKIFTNVNPLYGTRIAHSARQNLDNAFLKPGNFYNVRLDYGPRHKRTEWSAVLTKEVNRILKRHRRARQPFADMWSATNAQTVLHGIGPVWWSGRENPIPREIGIEDVLVPAQTLLNCTNLEFFGVYRQWTYAELYDMTHGAARDPGWNMALVKQLLNSLAEQPLQSTVMGNRWLFPEKLAEDLKENAGLFATSAAPTIFVWDFYFRDYNDKDNDEHTWERRVVLDYMQLQPEALRSAVSDMAKQNFLYSKEGVYANDLSEILHFQIGNCSNVAPFRYYSVRSLGFLTYAALQVMNRLYCRGMDSVFENSLQYFRNVGEDDREKLEKVDLWHMGIVPDGLSFVTAAERHEMNQQLYEMGMSMNRQLLQESSSVYMPEVDTGTKKEQTLGEAQIKLQTSVSLANALLNQAYTRAESLYREQCRRFCIRGSKNNLVKEFQARVLAQGVPPEMLDPTFWDVEPERVLGGGNKAIEGLQADRLMAVRGALDPEAQRQVLHMYVEANTDDPKLAEELVPMDEKPISEATTLATLAMGTLMDGLPVVQKRSLNHVDYVQMMLGLSAQVLQQVEQLAQVPQSLPIRMQKIGGLTSVLEHVAEHLQMILSDEAMAEAGKAFEEEFRRQMAEVQRLAESLNEEMQAQNPQAQDGEMAKLQAKLQALVIEAEQRARAKDADAEQKRQHKDAAFMAENERRNATTEADIARKQAMTQVELQSAIARTQADVLSKDLTTAAEIRRPKPETKGAE